LIGLQCQRRIGSTPTVSAHAAQHLVPLSRQALELLLKLRMSSEDSEYVFPSLRDPSRPLHGAGLGGALWSLGFDRSEVTPHGFQATACTLLNELGWRSEAIERQMAYGTANDVHRHYNYAQHLPERRVMMQAWADYLDELSTPHNVARSQDRTADKLQEGLPVTRSAPSGRTPSLPGNGLQV
jgi:integrase